MAINHASLCVEIFQKKKKTLFNVIICPKQYKGFLWQKLKAKILTYKIF